MQSHSWLTFLMVEQGLKTAVHFFPSSGAVGAPYLAHCKLAIFGNGIKKASIVVEGARLSHPDGLWIEDAFPHLAQSPRGLYGLEIEVTTMQPRVMLSGSSCIVEISSGERLSRYQPLAQKKGLTIPELGEGFCIKDPFCFSSVIAVNPSDAILNPELDAVVHRDVHKGELKGLACDRVAPLSVAELPMEPMFYEEGTIKECSWGLMRARRIQRKARMRPDAAYYLMFRNGRDRFPTAVSAL